MIRGRRFLRTAIILSQRMTEMADEEPALDYTRPQRAGQLLDGLTDGTLLVLKGHLLIEELLFKEVRTNFPNPELLDKANLSFYQLLQIARAMFNLATSNEKRQKSIETMWDGIEALNTLRNRLSHQLNPKDIGPLLRRMKADGAPTPLSLENPAVRSALSISIGFYLAFVSSLRVVEAEGKKGKIELFPLGPSATASE